MVARSASWGSCADGGVHRHDRSNDNDRRSVEISATAGSNGRIRVGGMAEISAFSTDLPDRRRATLEMSVSDLFPGGDLSRATF